jgi:mono/diheme cytochrome c family protein
MKKVYIICILSIFATLVQAKTTMCYKNNWNNPANIEQQIFDGGECKNQFSIKDMKVKGWIIDDIKLQINNDKINYIYILKKESIVKQNTTVAPTATQKVALQATTAIPMTARTIDYKQIAKEMKKQEKETKAIDDLAKGKKYYIDNCQECHGQKGEIESSGTSRALNKLTLDDMEDAIRKYQWNEYDRGMAMVMKPYASRVVSNDLKAIYKYIQSLK